jgi:adenylosuccinate synthase
VYVNGERFVMQQLPCAAYANPSARLVLGAGALISPEILAEEIMRNMEWRKRHSLPPLDAYVDYRAHVVQDHHKTQEEHTNLAATIGSTSTIAREGIGPAQASRVLREDFMTFEEFLSLSRLGFPKHAVRVADTVDLLHSFRDVHILLEGTQGTSLSNITGIYPYVTSRCTSAVGLAAECGVARLDDVIMVCRCHPIRVAGNSGPFFSGSEEIGWDELGVDPENERTTVTKKVRRVATFSYQQVAYNARINGATQIALTFADYVYAQLAEDTAKYTAVSADAWPVLGPMIKKIEASLKIPVRWIGTGPHSVIERQSVYD